MSEKHEQEVETIFSARDLVSKTVERIVGAGERINHVFNHASEMVGKFASVSAVVGGAFSLEHAIEEAKDYMKAIGRVSILTGLSANHTDALLESMEKVGIEGDLAERILLGMSKKTANMEMHMNALGQATGSTADMMKRLGIDMRKDTIDVMEQMADKVKKNKLGIDQLGIAFGIPRTQVINLYKMLKKGPEYIRENVAEMGKFGVKQGDLAAFARAGAATREIQSTWKRINIIVGTQFAPLIADLLKGGADKLKGWLEHAAAFGKTMSSFLREHHRLLIGIGKVMLANYAIQKATGSGLLNNVMGRGGQLAKFIGGGALKGGSLLSAPRALQLTAGPLEKIMMFMGRLGPLAGVLARFTLVGAIVATIVGAFLAIKNNVYGVRDKLVELWDRITLRFAAIKVALAPLFDAFSSHGTIGKFLSEVLGKIISALGDVVDGLMKTMHILIHVFSIIAQDGMSALTKPVLLWQTAASAARADMAVAARLERERKARDAAAEAAANRGAPETRDRQPYFDFRGSKFDIKQAFSDVDPDRIAVAFANDLAGMGERRVQSNAAPLWAV